LINPTAAKNKLRFALFVLSWGSGSVLSGFIAVSGYFAMTTRSNGPAEVGMLEGEGKCVRKSIMKYF